MKLIGDKLFQLAKGDFVKGLIMAMLTSLATAIYQQLTSSAAHLPTGAELLVMLKAAGTVGGIYLTKNFLTSSDDKFLKKEPKPE